MRRQLSPLLFQNGSGRRFTRSTVLRSFSFHGMNGQFYQLWFNSFSVELYCTPSSFIQNSHKHRTCFAQWKVNFDPGTGSFREPYTGNAFLSLSSQHMFLRVLKKTSFFPVLCTALPPHPPEWDSFVAFDEGERTLIKKNSSFYGLYDVVNLAPPENFSGANDVSAMPCASAPRASLSLRVSSSCLCCGLCFCQAFNR